MKSLLDDFDGLTLQEDAKQNKFKLSYYVPMDAESSSDLPELITARCIAAGIQVSAIWSVDEAEGVGLLDILPKHATKYHAVEFLRKYLQLELHQMLFAGDSGNDLEVLTSNIPSVLVANASEEIKQKALLLAKQNNTTETLYLAIGNDKSNGNYSAGILEGVSHYYPHLIKNEGT